jgi:hypothetical protein
MIYRELQGKLTAMTMARTTEDKLREMQGLIHDLAKIVKDQDIRIKTLEKKELLLKAK